MKLGTDTGSMANYLMSGTKGQPEPVLGMGVTFLSWTDRYAGTIVYTVAKGGKVVEFEAQEDEAIRTDSNGMSECQSYRFERNLGGARHKYRRDRKGQWRKVGDKWTGDKKVYGFVEPRQCIRLGERDHYHDYSF